MNAPVVYNLDCRSVPMGAKRNYGSGYYNSRSEMAGLVIPGMWRKMYSAAQVDSPVNRNRGITLKIKR